MPVQLHGLQTSIYSLYCLIVLLDLLLDLSQQPLIIFDPFGRFFFQSLP